MPPDPFPPDALDANRSGRLTPDQAALYRLEAASDRRNLLVAGLVVAALGATVDVGSLTGRITSGRLESFVVGAALLVVGALVAILGGIRGSRRKAAAAVDGSVGSADGPIRKDRRDRRNDVFGGSSNTSPGNEYAYVLSVGARSFPVSREQWEAAPPDGVVRVYTLGTSDRIVNLELIADAPAPQMPGAVRAALELESSAPDVARAAEARAMLDMARAMSTPRAGTDAQVAAAGGEPPVPAMAVGQSGAPALPLEQAILGTWQNDVGGMRYDFRADGSASASSARRPSREQRWSVAGPGTIEIDGSTLQVSVDGDRLSLGDPPWSLVFHRVV